MKLRFVIILLLLFGNTVFIFSQDNILEGDFNKDAKNDRLEYSYIKNTPYIKILLNGKSPIKKDLYISVERYSMPIEYEVPGYINIHEFSGSRFDNYFIYKWINDDWYLYGIFHQIESDGLVNVYLEPVNLRNTKKIGEPTYNYNVYDKQERINSKNLLDSIFTLYKQSYQIKDYKYIEMHNKYLSLDLLNYIEVDNSTVQKYNDIAYYIVSIPNCNEELLQEGISLLLRIVKTYPERTVAYINLGDAYWELNENTKAKEAYNKYIELMKANGKESKIPQRVLDRVR
ncbi:tetratricopeptide repeat protein [Plebeiibacterium marinum]|uniref:Tetratricopeptide repeat protein n=1 Tax=Plebeiibacterium marinum TaxID=2992111 RepID=A0AAE3MHJ7_9BACT|nr:tetratricopeptide repeat protein [Plebeiobacterium marinum]MCW3808113.1 tetratricopeptide repeat protein [Plebeiobacterium marinum]